ncbi:LuxR family transcriptional regulator [Micromonospora sp. WMMD1082]|uniref:LuxR family transcriptional regulator n=1 Tax=Micromonospora sp. WMMD1082 TaxID=3016104 RepID=UPI002415DFBC|nr:LuxR family transcriptional regulator [Micromonospora sp. WMMD1082]MDG4796337.1 LuxR C-terminal-related transcriptional regulator [Micromonospora sp. WMMD1082]
MPDDRSTVRADAAVHTPAGPPLLASRLAPAVLPEPVVLRPRLARLLDDAVARPVTLVRAPAGWGKSTLLASWRRALQEADPDAPAPAWVSIEVGDDPDRLWSYLTAALRSVADPDGPPATDRAPRPDELEILAATLAARERPVVLLVDDLHRITEPAALAGLEFLLRHTEQRLRLVAAGRTGPPLALHRLRLAGELTEIGPDELAFTGDEIADLLTAHGVAVPAVAVRRLQRRTAGWAAALRIAALALRDQPDPERWITQLGGDQPEIAGYLREELLGGVEPADRELLRRAAVVDTVCADLAAALSGDADAEGRLSGLAEGAGLLRHDGGQPVWYRCHPLLADLLRRELGRLPAGELRDLHLRAARWYAGNGRPADALRHALAGGDWTDAADLFVARWPELVPYDGTARTGPAPAPPPAEAVARDPELALACAAERALDGDADGAEAYLRLATGHAGRLPQPRRSRFGRLATAVELTLARLAGDHEAVRSAAARLLATRPGGHPAGVPATTQLSADPLGNQVSAGQVSVDPVSADPMPGRGSVAGRGPADAVTGRDADAVADRGPAGAVAGRGPGGAVAVGAGRGDVAGDADVRAVAGTALALLDLDAGDLSGAATGFAVALAAAREAGRPRTELVCASRWSLLAALRGELRAAEEAARAALALPPCQGWSARVDCGYAYLALAVVALHRDQPAEAEANLALAAPAGGEPAAGALAAWCRAYLRYDEGDLSAGHRLLVEARDGWGGRAGELGSWLLAAELDLHSARGDLQTARELAGDRPAEAVTRSAVPLAEAETGSAVPLAVAAARVELRAGDPRAAAHLLPDWTAAPTADWPLPVRLDAALLAALLAARGGDHRRAGRTLEQALDLAAPDGYRRPFIRAEPGLRDLLAAHLDSGTAHWSLVSDLVRAVDVSTGARADGDRAAVAPLDEPLTERELTILRYLQSILSNVEIAAELSVSVNTVKTHVRNIYRKLDATRRRDAVRRARQLHLI